MDREGEVLVVGAGNAALTAALSAAENGSKVTVLEKAPKEERGGNTVFTGGVFRHSHEGKTDIMRLVDSFTKEEWDQIEIGEFLPDDLYEEVMKVTEGKADPILTRKWVNESLDTVLWMKRKLGIRFTFNDVFTLKDLGVKKFRGPGVLMSEGKGVGLSQTLFSRCEENGNISIYYNTKVIDLLVDQSAVTGVKAQTGKGETVSLSAKAIVLGSGGFESSKLLREKYMGRDYGRAKVRGTKYNTGEVLGAALSSGAAPYGDFSDCHATPIDARSPVFGKIELTDKTARYSWMYGILVNKEGKRFVDEGLDFGDLLYAKLGKIIIKQPDSVAYQLFDKKMVPLLEKRYSSFPPINGESLDEFKGKLDLDIDSFKKTWQEFNEHVLGNVTFNSGIKDGLRTRGLNPDKSNWAQKLDTKPFTVYPVTGGITFTFGGLKIDASARVLNKKNEPIEGLFATGEITGGFFYNNYPAGSGLVRGAVFGKIAGYEAAKLI